MREAAGFTLIELMIVIVIIGVISTVALLSATWPAYRAARGNIAVALRHTG